MVMRLDAPPYDNPDLRLALKLSAKRQEMVDKVEGGRRVHEDGGSLVWGFTKMHGRRCVW